MARPKKRTVDYFPHFVNDGKVKTLVENKFGNIGYTCYYKIQERLADTDNHYIDLRDDLNYEYFIGEIKIDEEEITPIIEYLCKLKYLCKNLWSNKILWSDQFVENITDAYSKRLGSYPTKPTLDSNNNIINIVPEAINEVNESINTQRKGKEIKGNKKKYSINDFKLDTTGNSHIGYCSKCNISDFYSKYNIWGYSKCCNSKLIPEREDVTNVTKNR